MNKLRVFFFCIVLVSLFSCSDENKNNFKINDFENIDGWFKTPLIRKGNAHSGSFYCQIDSVSPYSFTYSKKINEITNQPVQKIKTTAWISFTSFQCKANLVVTVDSGDDTPVLFWKGTPAENVVAEKNKWTKVTLVTELPKRINKNARLLIYVWNTGKEPVNVDDLSFQFE